MAKLSKKVKPEPVLLPGSWTHVDSILEEMAALDLEIGVDTASFAAGLLKLLGEHRLAIQPLKDSRAELEARVEAYCLAHKDEFAKKRSRQLTFGKIAFRVAEHIECLEDLEAVVILTLKTLGHANCVKSKEKIDKDALKDLDDAELARCGLKRRKEDRFRIEPNIKIFAEHIGQEYSGPAVNIDVEKLAKLLKCAQGSEEPA